MGRFWNLRRTITGFVPTVERGVLSMTGVFATGIVSILGTTLWYIWFVRLPGLTPADLAETLLLNSTGNSLAHEKEKLSRNSLEKWQVGRNWNFMWL